MKTGLEKRKTYVTESDKAKLEDLLDYVKNVHTRDRDYVETLEEELEHAEVVTAADILPDVVTMNSQVRVRDLDTKKVVVYRLVFPWDADYSRERISILAPIGTALLGYRVGDVIEWKVPSGTRRLKVESVSYQPEAAGDESDSATSRHRFALLHAGV